jgi:hypothetical protein
MLARVAKHVGQGFVFEDQSLAGMLTYSGSRSVARKPSRLNDALKAIG